MNERFVFDGELFHWRGPSPFYFISVPEPHSGALHQLSAEVSYGWGMIPATVTIGESTWETSLFPKDGGYLVPVRKQFRLAEQVEEGEVVQVLLTVSGR